MEFLSEDQLERLGTWLISQTSVRQLVLDGLTSKESRILLKRHSFEEIQRLLRNDPYCIPSLKIERIDEIVQQWKWRVPNADRTLGEVARYLNDEWWEKSKAYLSSTECQRLFPNWEVLQHDLQRKYDWVLTRKRDEVSKVIHPRALYSEQRLRRALDRLISLPNEEYELQLPVPGDLDEDQLTAIKLALRSPVTIITGAAGCGKTRVQRELFRQFSLLNIGPVVLGSFTGKAVQRMAELIPEAEGDSAPRTLHRLLGDTELSGGCKVLNIDEASMVASTLLSRVLGDTNQLTKLILVGDPQQIRPIDPGPLHLALDKWLTDLGRQDCHIKLTHQHRQDGGHLLSELTRLSRDTTWRFVPQHGDNLEWYSGGIGEILQMVDRLQKSGVKMLECTVITPYKKIVKELNPLLREIWNPGNNGSIGEESFRVGDRVMITKNSSKYNLYNGMEGIVSRVGYDGVEIRFGSMTDLKKWMETKNEDGIVLHFFARDELQVVARRDDNYINEIDGPTSYDDDDADVLTTDLLVLSSALTVHKSQGSEWEIVICFLPYDTPLATRKLTYTALSRAKKRVILFGNLANVYAACNRPDDPGRALWPEEMIEEYDEGESEE
jgi:exodeoxyribonuclease V alpha subunit